jgi:hypothetical protein
MRPKDLRSIGADRRMRDFMTSGLDTAFDHSNISEANEISGSQAGANSGRHWATPGHGQPLSVQLDATPGHVQHRLPTARKCLLSSGPQVRVLFGAQFTVLFSLLCSHLGSQWGSQSPGTSRGETAEFWIQPGWTRTRQRALWQPGTPAGVMATPSLALPRGIQASQTTYNGSSLSRGCCSSR